MRQLILGGSAGWLGYKIALCSNQGTKFGWDEADQLSTAGYVQKLSSHVLDNASEPQGKSWPDLMRN